LEISMRLIASALLFFTLTACNVPDDAPTKEVAPAEWKRVAPGVWERVRSDGGHEQIGIGVQALKAELQRLRVERALRQQVSAMGGTSGELAGPLRESDKRIHFLETGLAELENAGVRELAEDEELLRSILGGTEGTPSGPYCGGYFGFEVEFSYGMAGGGVTTRGGWTEFGPYAPYTKTLYVYASGWLYSRDEEPSDTNADSEGPFSRACCVSVETAAAAYPTFTPGLEGGGYILGSSGCGAPLYYRAWN
jgi:hypothetical protein